MARYKSPDEYLRIMGLRPGASKMELRQAYLALVKQWHPDKFPHNSPAQLLAQEKLKAINEAYMFLRIWDPNQPQPWYYEPTPQPRSYPRGATAQWQEYQRRQNYRPPARDPYAGDYQYRPVGESKGKKFMWIWAAVMIINFAAQFGHSDRGTPAPSKVVQLAQSPSKTAGASTVADQQPSPAATQQELPYFFVGSSKRDVYRIQGMPDFADDEEWRYGDSRVHFRGQVVASWESRSVPLKAVNLPAPDSLRFISVGSSTRDVLAIQGPPTAVLDGYWQYGASRIDFAEGRVTGWSEHPESPLKVRHLKNM